MNDPFPIHKEHYDLLSAGVEEMDIDLQVQVKGLVEQLQETCYVISNG